MLEFVELYKNSTGLLPYRPDNLNDKWKEIKAHKSCKEISMRYELDVITAGIPTWFIARSHRFTTNPQWIKGALFADENKRHFAQIQAFPNLKYLKSTATAA